MAMRTITRKKVFGSGTRKVWGFITNPLNFPEYVSGYAKDKTSSRNKIGRGARYEWYGKLGPLRLKSVEEVVKWQERKKVAYAGKLAGISFSSSMALQEIKKGRTLLTITIGYKVPAFFWGKIMDKLVIRGIVENQVNESLSRLEKIFNSENRRNRKNPKMTRPSSV